MCVINGKLKVVDKTADIKALEEEEFKKWNKQFWEKKRIERLQNQV